MNKICMLVEGSYPFVSGGVSSWVNQIIEAMPEIEFNITAIMPSEDPENMYKYKIHANINEIKVIYIQDFKKYDPSPQKREPRITPGEIDEIKKFIRFNDKIDWEIIANTIGNKEKIGTPVEFLHSKTFWNILLEYYNEFYPEEEFNEFFWTFNSMLIFFITIMQSELPESDVYHAVSTGYPGLMGMIAAKKRKKPFILTEHGIYAREREEDIIKADWVKGIYKKIWINFFYFISKGAYSTADKIIALFERNMEFQISLGAAPEITEVIPNGVDLKHFSNEKSGHDGINVGAILRVVPIKDVKTLIRGFKLLSARIDNAKLYIIGPYEEDPEYYAQCKMLVDILEINDKVIFTGKVNAAEYIRIMDIVCLSSVSEAQPLVILEAMACERAVVATDVGACKELLQGTRGDEFGEAGIVVKPVSPRELGEAVYKLAVNEELRREMGRIGRKRVSTYYTKEMFLKKYNDLYKKAGVIDGWNRI